MLGTDTNLIIYFFPGDSEQEKVEWRWKTLPQEIQKELLIQSKSDTLCTL